MNLLHIYAQAWEHSDAWIVGNRDGLTALRDALNRALANEKTEPVACLQFAADGEGFACFIVPNDADWQGEKWQKLYRPYTDETARDHRKDKDVLAPYQLLGDGEYRRLYEGLKEAQEDED
jgi:hypothetical protein